MAKKKSKIRVGLVLGAVAGGVIGSLAASKIPVGNEKIKALIPIGVGTGLTMVNNEFALGAGLGMCGAGGARLGTSLGIGGTDEVIIGDVMIDGADDNEYDYENESLGGFDDPSFD